MGIRAEEIIVFEPWVVNANFACSMTHRRELSRNCHVESLAIAWSSHNNVHKLNGRGAPYLLGFWEGKSRLDRGLAEHAA